MLATIIVIIIICICMLVSTACFLTGGTSMFDKGEFWAFDSGDSGLACESLDIFVSGFLCV